MNENIFASRVSHLKASAIREIFKLLADPSIISFAGGAPAAELFPGKELSEISREILESKPEIALQYGVTEGYAPLVELLKSKMNKIGNVKEYDGIIVTQGAQQVIDLFSKSLIEDGDTVVVEIPSFIGALNSFRSYNAKLVGVELQDDGLDVDALEAIAKKQKIKLLYTIPTFQNPSGITMSVEKRKKIIEFANKYDFYVLEDNPYGELRYKGEDVPTIKSFDTEGRVVYAGTFSKILSAGLRVGYTVARKDILEKMVVCKQVSDVHSPILNQMLVVEFDKRYSLGAHTKKSCDLYGRKSALMLKCMDETFPDFCAYTRPEGGIFIWCTLPERFDTKELFKRAVEKKVAFVPGSTCMIDLDAPCSMFRLNYSNSSDEKIVEGISALAELLKSC